MKKTDKYYLLRKKERALIGVYKKKRTLKGIYKRVLDKYGEAIRRLGQT